MCSLEGKEEDEKKNERKKEEKIESFFYSFPPVLILMVQREEEGFGNGTICPLPLRKDVFMRGSVAARFLCVILYYCRMLYCSENRKNGTNLCESLLKSMV